jgi:Zn-dependent protease
MTKKIKINRNEIWEILKAWSVISLAFAIILARPFVNKIEFPGVLVFFGIALLTVGLGFLFHELAHKIIAQKYKCEAEFKADNKNLLLAFGTSFLGVMFAAPGAVYIKGYINKVQNGIISLSGPLMNLILALVFLPGMLLINQGLLGLFFLYGFIINSWLGLFNMIPVGNFDGSKIYAWNKKVYYATAITLLIMTVFGMFLQ